MLIAAREPVILDMNGWGMGIEFVDPPETGIIIKLAEHARDGEDFFGASHYVEIGDQKNGRYGGIINASVSEDRLACSFTLSFDAPPWGSKIELTFEDPLSDHDVRFIERIVNEKDR